MGFLKSLDHERVSTTNGQCEASCVIHLLVDKQTHETFFVIIADFYDYFEKHLTHVTTQPCKVIL